MSSKVKIKVSFWKYNFDLKAILIVLPTKRYNLVVYAVGFNPYATKYSFHSRV
jgi:hypothetical protein